MKAAACAMATALALGMSVPVLAGETVTEHETYEKRSMKVEPVPPPVVTERRSEETETSRTDSPPRNPPTIVEKHTTVVPGGTVTERKSERVETDHDD